MTNEEQFYSFADIVTGLRKFSHYLIRRWWKVLLVGLLCATIGFLYHRFIQKSHYEAVCTFILEEKQSGLGGLGGIASQFGVDVPGMGSGGSIFAGDNILNVIKSKRVVQQVLLSRIDSNDADKGALADLYLDYTGLGKMLQAKNVTWDFNTKNRISADNLNDSILNVIYNRLVKKNLTTDRVSKKGTVIQVQVSAENRFFAKLLAERLVDASSRLYLNIKTGNAQENIRNLQRRSDSLLILLNRKSYTAAASQPLDINPGIRTAAVPVEIVSRDKTVLAALYTEVTKNLEASKLLLMQQSPVIQVLDTPGMFLQDKKMGLVAIMLLSAMVGAVAYIVLLGVSYFIRNA